VGELLQAEVNRRGGPVDEEGRGTPRVIGFVDELRQHHAWTDSAADELPLAPLQISESVPKELVDAPAICDRCKILYAAPTTGKAQSPCWCGGRLWPVTYPLEGFMHDAKGRELKAGDRILIPCEVRDVQASPEYCNVTVVSLGGRKPDGLRETITLNTNVLLRANDGDDASFEVFVDGDKQYIR
jgi:hypothetical protein